METLPITDKDLGEWFRVDGVAIKNQMELDLAVINLAEMYGIPVAPAEMMATIARDVARYDQQDDSEVNYLELFLCSLSDKAFQAMNSLLPDGFRFDYRGSDYSKFWLVGD